MSENHFFCQWNDGGLDKATANPPTVTSGAFGSEVHDGGAGQIPASWSEIDDNLVYSNGADQHQIYGGTSSFIEKFIVYKGTAAIPSVPQEGEDYSDKISDGLTTTVAVLDDLNTYANYDCLFFRTPVPAKSITITVSKANGNTSTASIYYWKNTSAWTAASGFADATSTGGKSLGLVGANAMSWTAPTDLEPKYAFGSNGFWYQIRFDAALDSEVEITGVTYAADFQSIINMWDGTPTDAVEAQFFVATAGTYAIFGSQSVEIDSMVASNDRIYFSTADPIVGIYIDPGETVNSTASTTINTVYGWTGAAFTAMSGVTDGSDGISHAGWVTWAKNADVQPHQFQSSQYYAFWYYFTVDQTLSDDVIIAIQTLPFFDIDELGKSETSCAWKDRVTYSFDRWAQFLYVSESNAPLVLNGFDFGILEAGDGRANKIVAQRRFHNELMVWQQEQGVEGGCLTLFEGYSPTTFGKLVLSSTIGTFSNKSVCVVDGVLTSTQTNEELKTLVFFLSRYGVCVTDGLTVSIISDDIQNYFDPTESECIRRGYEDQMWIAYDSAFNVVRIGLVSGNATTLPNVFPVFDLTDKVWSFDKTEQSLSFVGEVGATSGDVQVLQVGGGIDDGFVYQLNYLQDDVSTAVDSFAQMELDANGEHLQLLEAMLRCKSQGYGGISWEMFKNSRDAGKKTLSMQPERPMQESRRHRFTLNLTDEHISIKIGNNGVGEEMELFDIGLRTDLWDKR